MPIRFSAFGRVFAPSWPMTLLTSSCCSRRSSSLGRWQWHRGEAEAGGVGRVRARRAAPPLGIARLRRASSASRDFESTGHFEPAHQFLLDNRSHAGQPGYEVLTPFVARRRPAHPREPRLGSVQRLSRPLAGRVAGATPATSRSPARIDELPSGGLASGRAPPGGRCELAQAHELSDARGARRPRSARSSQRRILLLDPDAPDGYVREWSPPGLRARRGTSLMPSSGGVLPSCCSCSTSASIFARCPDARFPRAAAGAHC